MTIIDAVASQSQSQQEQSHCRWRSSRYRKSVVGLRSSTIAVDLYSEHNTDKLGTIPKILKKFRGEREVVVKVTEEKSAIDEEESSELRHSRRFSTNASNSPELRPCHCDSQAVKPFWTQLQLKSRLI